MKYIIFGIYLYSLLARIFHWLSIWQQKEYRIDRIRAFLVSPEGRSELATLINFPLKLSRIRRPRPTPKAIVILLSTLFLIASSQANNLLSYTIIYLLVPAYVIVASLPAWIITYITQANYNSTSKKLLNKHKPLIIGITGSYGKTTTKHILTHIIKAKTPVWTSPKSFNTPLSLTQAFNTTYQDESIIVIEFAAYQRGEISTLANIFHPDIAILTGITHQHLATFKTKKNLIKAKSELPQALLPESVFIYNSNSADSTKIAKSHSNLKLIPSDSVVIKSSKLSKTGSLSFILNGKQTNTNLKGLHYLENIKLAVACAKTLNLSNKQISSQLESFVPNSNFTSIINLSNNRILIDDGNTTNPTGFLAGLALLSHFKKISKVVISPGIIDLAQETDSTHKMIANQSSKIIDYFIHTSPTAHKTLKLGLTGKKYSAINNLETFKSFIKTKLSQDTAILIEGKIPADFLSFIRSL